MIRFEFAIKLMTDFDYDSDCDFDWDFDYDHDCGLDCDWVMITYHSASSGKAKRIQTNSTFPNPPIPRVAIGLKSNRLHSANSAGILRADPLTVLPLGLTLRRVMGTLNY